MSTLKTPNKMMRQQSYESTGRLDELINRNAAGQVLSSFKNSYYANGNLKSVTDQNGKTISYLYDDNGQLENETLATGGSAAYTYDAFGNRTTRVETKTDGTTVTTNYEYDGHSNRLTSVDGTAWDYWDNGNLKSNGKYSFEWDSANRLTKITDKNTGNTIAEYQYDAQNRRVYQRNAAGNVTKFLYDDTSSNVIAEYDGTGKLKKSYTWSPSGELLSLTDHSTGKTYYTVFNNHGDIIELRDSNGNLAAAYTYDAWGNILSQSGTAASLNSYRYAGYRYDEDTGLYYLINRYYNAKVGRFISEDPVMTTNLYAYSGNDPVNASDPLGLWAEDDFDRRLKHMPITGEEVKNIGVSGQVVQGMGESSKTALSSPIPTQQGTKGIGVTVQAAATLKLSLSVEYVWDNQGNHGILVSGVPFTGGGTPSIGIVGTYSKTDANSINDLRGWATNGGGSANIIIGVGKEMNYGDGNFYSGVTYSFGIKGIPEVHSDRSASWLPYSW